MKIKTILILLLLTLLYMDSFSQTLDAGNDTTICPGSLIRLNGVGDDNIYYYYRWTPSSTLYDSTVIRPYAAPTASTTYYLYGYKQDDNVVVNGDFEAGNSSFISTYTYNSISLWNEGTYSIVHSANDVHSDFYDAYDHTLGTYSGNYLAVNGSGVPNSIIWSQTIPVFPNTTYVFNTWVMTLAGNASEVAQLQFSINNSLIGQVFQAPFPPSAGWVQFYTLWESGNNTSAVITIVNQNVVLSGNDFAIDDIVFAPVTPDIDSVTVFIQPPQIGYDTAYICYGGSFVLGDTILVESGDFSWTFTNDLGCDSIVYLHLTETPQVIVNLGEDRLFCRSDSLFTILYGGDSTLSYVWNNQSTADSLIISETGTYSVTASDYIGCSDSDWIEITIIEDPPVEITNLTENFCDEYKASLSVTTNAPSILWNTGESVTEIEVHEFGVYFVIVAEEHCVSRDTIEIEFCCPDHPDIPNVITPSKKDGINDTFKFLDGFPADTFELLIYNRWGKIVFKSTDPLNQWDGTINGKLQNGTFYYVIDMQDGCTFHGTIMVL